MKKQKYSLAISRIDKLFKLKNNMDLNINSLEKLELKLSDIIKNKKEQKNNIYIGEKNSKLKLKITLKASKTPSPIMKDRRNFSTIQINKTNNNSSKSKINSSSKKILNNSIKKKNTFKITEKKREKSFTNLSSISKTSTQKKIIVNKNEKIENKNDIKNNNNDIKVIKEQKEIIEKLKKEIDSLKQQCRSNNNSYNESKIDNNMQLKLENNVLLFLNEKLKLISN
jgi:hypothetical protein